VHTHVAALGELNSSNSFLVTSFLVLCMNLLICVSLCLPSGSSDSRSSMSLISSWILELAVFSSVSSASFRMITMILHAIIFACACAHCCCTIRFMVCLGGAEWSNASWYEDGGLGIMSDWPVLHLILSSCDCSCMIDSTIVSRRWLKVSSACLASTFVSSR
jgi:hypothetical protein